MRFLGALASWVRITFDLRASPAELGRNLLAQRGHRGEHALRARRIRVVAAVPLQDADVLGAWADPECDLRAQPPARRENGLAAWCEVPRRATVALGDRGGHEDAKPGNPDRAPPTQFVGDSFEEESHYAHDPVRAYAAPLGRHVEASLKWRAVDGLAQVGNPNHAHGCVRVLAEVCEDYGVSL